MFGTAKNRLESLRNDIAPACRRREQLETTGSQSG